MTTLDLLKRSESEHERAKALRKSRQTVGARLALQSARDLRLLALAQDPDMTEAEWASNRYPHDELLAFYALQLDG